MKNKIVANEVDFVKKFWGDLMVFSYVQGFNMPSDIVTVYKSNIATVYESVWSNIKSFCFPSSSSLGKFIRITSEAGTINGSYLQLWDVIPS